MENPKGNITELRRRLSEATTVAEFNNLSRQVNDEETRLAIESARQKKADKEAAEADRAAKIQKRNDLIEEAGNLVAQARAIEGEIFKHLQGFADALSTWRYFASQNKVIATDANTLAAELGIKERISPIDPSLWGSGAAGSICDRYLDHRAGLASLNESRLKEGLRPYSRFTIEAMKSPYFYAKNCEF
jgi:hypothetical protein